jgi:hypothetical protein
MTALGMPISEPWCELIRLHVVEGRHSSYSSLSRRWVRDHPDGRIQFQWKCPAARESDQNRDSLRE